jgi:hypothetical protein
MISMMMRCGGLTIPNGGKRLRAAVRRLASGHQRRDDTKPVTHARSDHPKAGIAW